MTKVFDSDLPTTEKMVLLAMADYASDTGDSIFPSIKTMSRKTSLSERSVQNTIKSLIEKNYLILIKKGGGRNKTNLYKIRCSRFAVFEDGFELKGETGTKKGEPPAPDPSLNIINPSQSANADNDELKYEDCDDDGLEVKEKKTKKKPDNKSLYPIAQALAQVSGVSFEANRSQIFREAKYIVRDPRITAEEIIRQFAPGGDWYRCDFRGQKGQRPTVTQVRQTIFTFVEPRVNKPKGWGAIERALEKAEKEEALGNQ
jgi:hypothetical protein